MKESYMKLSSRKQLLKEADDVLKEISERVLAEFDFENQRKRMELLPGVPYDQVRLIEWKLKKELDIIERKYRSKNDPMTKQKEREELIAFAEKLKKHVLENYKPIPEDPDKQTEIQKLIVKAPPFPQNYDYVRNFAKTLIKDPETGMYWSIPKGTPELPPDWKKDQLEYRMEFSGSTPRDYSRGWFYNLLRKIFLAGDA